MAALSALQTIKTAYFRGIDRDCPAAICQHRCIADSRPWNRAAQIGGLIEIERVWGSGPSQAALTRGWSERKCQRRHVREQSSNYIMAVIHERYVAIPWIGSKSGDARLSQR